MRERTRELSKSKAKYRGMFDNSQEPIALARIVRNEDGKIIDSVLVDANPAAVAAYQARVVEDVIGKRFSEIFGQASLEPHVERLQRLESLGKPFSVEVRLGSDDQYSSRRSSR